MTGQYTHEVVTANGGTKFTGSKLACVIYLRDTGGARLFGWTMRKLEKPITWSSAVLSAGPL